jgi:conjugative relaxase-like TrwC/TraI family protein
MLKISKAVGPTQAKRYYQSELKNDAEILLGGSPCQGLDQESSIKYEGKWYGRLANEIGLKGGIKTEHFERLCDGLNPFDSEEMVRRASIKNYVGKSGKEITTMERRALWDATFSAPKSVSLTAIVGGDDRVREAHRESVRTALFELENSIEARIGNKNLSERTGKMICATFEHDFARPDNLYKIATPQLHTHAAIFNVTKTQAGVTRAIQPYEIYKSQSLATAVYRIELADRLQKLGYEIEIDSKTRAPEIKGFDQEYLKESSLRSAQIQREAEIVKNKFALEGAEVKNDAGIRQVAAWQNRESKGFDIEEMKTRALELEVKYDFQAQRIYGQSLQNGFQYDASDSFQNARNAVEIAKHSTSLQNQLPTEKQFLTEALTNGIGSTNSAAIRAEYVSQNAVGKFSNFIKNEQNVSSSSALDQKPQRSVGENQESKKAEQSLSAEKETKSSKEAELSMSELENMVKKSVTIEKEVAPALELFMGL